MYCVWQVVKSPTIISNNLVFDEEYKPCSSSIHNFLHLLIAPLPLDLNTFLSTLLFNILKLYGRPTVRVDLHAVASLSPGNPHASWCRSLLIHRCTYMLTHRVKQRRLHLSASLTQLLPMNCVIWKVLWLYFSQILDLNVALVFT